MKKVLCTLLSVALCLTMVSFPVSAEESARYTISPEVAGTETAVVLTDEDLTINEEVAEYIAQFFVEDMMATGQTTWETEPTIVETVPMYDANGEEITAYTVELSSGYVVVSAYIDVPNIILEWADEAEPVYSLIDVPLSNTGKIVYTGALNYFRETSTNELVAVEGKTFLRNEVNDVLSKQRAKENIPSDVISEYGKAQLSPAISKLRNGGINDEGGVIDDPFIHAQNVYGGTWVNKEYANVWEDVAIFFNKSDIPTNAYAQACGTIAITNIVKMYGAKYNNSYLKNRYADAVFYDVVAVSDRNPTPFYINSIGGGVDPDDVPPYILSVFDNYNIDVTIYGDYYATYQDLKNALSTDERLIYLCLEANTTNNPYDNHAVVGYAYTQLRNVSSGRLVSYLKICDGMVGYGRYMDTAVTKDFKYWEVHF